MIFEQIRTGGDRNFAYLVGDEKTKDAAAFDPSNDPALVISRAEEHGLDIKFLFNTHGHSDHTNGNRHLLANTDAELVENSDNRTVQMGDVSILILSTPGHTPDSACMLISAPGETSKLVTGDTLFVGKVGGTGYGQDARDEYDSLHERIMTLPPETEIWPGHDYGTAPNSTVGLERETNPFILRETFEAFLDLKRNWAAYKKEHGIS